ncbi:hypothetical protein ALC57_08595 [Trachymyrmex cornetzi]|uniref:Uncharacterized protein n=1 Tax=Trachymyrmex cornetzi TaxID=471704 RepID=A0A151J6T8_9HYME|nr:hypothetical protein ALC57_08595 [Trachymyrmex cornetzi]
MTIITAVFVPWTVWIFVTLVHSSEDGNKNNADEKNKYLALLLEPKDPANDFLTNDRFETIASSSTSTTMNGLPRRRQKSPFSQLCSE